MLQFGYSAFTNFTSFLDPIASKWIPSRQGSVSSPGDNCIRCVVITFLILMGLMGLLLGTLVKEHESSRPQTDKHISRRARSSMATPGVIAGIVLGCVFGLLAVCIISVIIRLKKKQLSNAERPPGEYSLSPADSDLEWGHRRPRLHHHVHELNGAGDYRFDIGSSKVPIRAIYLSSMRSFVAPTDLWTPTESERAMVEAQKNNTAFHLPSFSMQSFPLEDRYWSQDGPSQTTEKDITEEKISSSVPDDRFDGKDYTQLSSDLTANNPLDDPASISGICNKPSAEPPQSNNPPSPPDLAESQSAPTAESRSNISQAEDKSEQAIIHCPTPHCTRTFTQQYKLNHHLRYHEKPKQCPTCDKSFGTTKDLGRHINSMHTSTKQWHCPVQDCKHSKTGKGGFDRKDNWRRHVRDAHKLKGEEGYEDS